MSDYEIVSKTGDVSPKDVHPSNTSRRSAKFEGTDLPDTNGVDGRESKYVRCKQCGFILDSTKTSRGSGYGNETYKAIPGTSKVEPVASAGCPFCASSEW